MLASRIIVFCGPCLSSPRRHDKSFPWSACHGVEKNQLHHVRCIMPAHCLFSKFGFVRGCESSDFFVALLGSFRDAPRRLHSGCFISSYPLFSSIHMSLDDNMPDKNPFHAQSAPDKMWATRSFISNADQPPSWSPLPNG